MIFAIAGCQTGGSPEPAEQQTPQEPAEPEKTDSEEPYEVSEEVYQRTFTEIEKLIDNLNETIRSKDFEGWKEKLTQDYIDTMSSQVTLQAISEKPALKDSGIEIDSLEDYFLNVVVPSRANSRVDEIVFVNDNRIKAFMVINGQKTILYSLVKIDGQWKIGTSQ